MIATPFMFEANLSDEDFQKIGRLSLRWSHIEHVAGNCLKTMLRLTDQEATIIVFPMNLEQRVNRMTELSEIDPLPEGAKFLFTEFRTLFRGIQYVRNNVIHAIVGGDKWDQFHIRSKNRTMSKFEIFSSEEITNYTSHVVISLRYALGPKDGPAWPHALPDRPEIPEFLRSVIQFPTPKKEAQKPPQQS